MSYEQRIRDNRQRMSKSFARLADYVLDSYIQSALMTATELAHQVDVDAATVVRFAQKLGYSGFPQLQSEIKDRVKQDLLIRPAQAEIPDSIPGVVSDSMEQLIDALVQARKLLDVDQVEKLVVAIGKARKIMIMPEGLGQAAAYNLVSLLERGGFLVAVTQPGVTNLARTVSSASQDDLLIAIDVSGDAPFIARALSEAKKRKISTAAIVGAASFQSAIEADVVLAAQNQISVDVGIVIVDAVVMALAQALRWKYQDRFDGADEAVEALFHRIQIGNR